MSQPDADRATAVWRVFLPPPGWADGSFLEHDRGLCTLITATSAGFQTWTSVLRGRPFEEPPGEDLLAAKIRLPPLDGGPGDALLAFQVVGSPSFDAWGITLHVVDRAFQYRVVRLEPRVGWKLQPAPQAKGLGKYFEAPTRCDAPGCTAPVTFECACSRCSSESDPAERYHSCAVHQTLAGEEHVGVRERPVQWKAMV